MYKDHAKPFDYELIKFLSCEFCKKPATRIYEEYGSYCEHHFWNPINDNQSIAEQIMEHLADHKSKTKKHVLQTSKCN